MKEEKFIGDTKTVLKFIQLYCDEKHTNEQKEKENLELVYNEKSLETITYDLCPTCKQTFLYSYKRLQKCPHEEKPRCRKCPAPCYEKSKWKDLAKIMKFSGMKLGLNKIKNLFVKK